MNTFLVVRCGLGMPNRADQKCIVHLAKGRGRARLITGKNSHYGILIETPFDRAYVAAVFTLLDLDEPDHCTFIHRVTSFEMEKELSFELPATLAKRAVSSCLRYHRYFGYWLKRHRLKRSMSALLIGANDVNLIDRALEKVAVCGRDTVASEDLALLDAYSNARGCLN